MIPGTSSFAGLLHLLLLLLRLRARHLQVGLFVDVSRLVQFKEPCLESLDLVEGGVQLGIFGSSVRLGRLGSLSSTELNLVAEVGSARLELGRNGKEKSLKVGVRQDLLLGHAGSLLGRAVSEELLRNDSLGLGD